MNTACSHSYVEAKKIDLMEVERMGVTGGWEGKREKGWLMGTKILFS